MLFRVIKSWGLFRVVGCSGSIVSEIRSFYCIRIDEFLCSIAYSMIIPRLIRHTVGIVAIGSRRYIDWLEALNR